LTRSFAVDAAGTRVVTIDPGGPPPCAIDTQPSRRMVASPIAGSASDLGKLTPGEATQEPPWWLQLCPW
jgi:hypothetical protein